MLPDVHADAPDMKLVYPFKTTMPNGGELQHYKREDVQFQIGLMVTHLFQFVGELPNDIQVRETVRLILTNYPDMGVIELRMAFDRLRSGAFKVYGKLTPLALMEVVKSVYKSGQEHRCEIREQRNRESKLMEMYDSALQVASTEQLRDYREHLERKIETTESDSAKDRRTFNERRKELLVRLDKRLSEEEQNKIA